MATEYDESGVLQVKEMKEAIHETHGLGEPELLKLIYTGKVLKNDQTIGSANIKEGAFVVVMVSKVFPHPLCAPLSTRLLLPDITEEACSRVCFLFCCCAPGPYSTTCVGGTADFSCPRCCSAPAYASYSIIEQV
jgi:hypothetical protein